MNFPAGFASTSFAGFSPAAVVANLQQFRPNFAAPGPSGQNNVI